MSESFPQQEQPMSKEEATVKVLQKRAEYLESQIGDTSGINYHDTSEDDDALVQELKMVKRQIEKFEAVDSSEDESSERIAA